MVECLPDIHAVLGSPLGSQTYICKCLERDGRTGRKRKAERTTGAAVTGTGLNNDTISSQTP